jgi:hypothetical protein
MNEKMQQHILDELRTLGVRYELVTDGAGHPIGVVMLGTMEWSVEFSRKIAGIFARHGMREQAEGQWGTAGATADQTRRWEEAVRAYDERAARDRESEEES